MSDDPVEMLKALINQVGKRWIMEELKKLPGRPGRKAIKDLNMLIQMGRIMAWHEDIPVRTAAKMVAIRSTPKSHMWSAIEDRIRKKFTKNESHYRRVGKVNEVINLTIAIRFADAPDPVAACTAATAPDKRTARLIPPDDDALDSALGALHPKRPRFYTFPEPIYTLSEFT